MAQHVSSKNLLLSTRPLVVGVLPGVEALQDFLSATSDQRSQLCDVVELRLDQLGMAPETLLAETASLETPLLVTARHPAEGGVGHLSAPERLALLRPFLGRASLVDVELRSLMDMREAIREAQSCGTGVVASFHDFERTPALDVLEGAAAMAESMSLDAVKVATFLNTTDDLVTLLKFVSAPRRIRVCAMGMGELGAVSRLVLAKCGSVLNYGYLGGVGNAPGQWPAFRLKAVLADL